MADSDEDSQHLKSLNKKISAENHHENFNKKVKMVPPDGGWGWFVVLGSFLSIISGMFPLFAFSILFSPILMSSGVTSTKIAWIYNFHTLIWSTYMIFVGPLCDEFGWRKVAIFGGITNFISIFLSAFSPTPDFLFFSFSFLGGIGGCSALSLSFYVVSRYFEKYRGFALGITTTGSCLSSFLAPIVANYLLENFNYMGASLILSAIVLNQCVGGSFYHPVEWHMIPKEIDPATENILNEETLNLSHNVTEASTDTEENAHKRSAVSTHSSDVTTFKKSSFSESLNENKNDQFKNKSKISKRGLKFINVLKRTYDNVKTLKYMRVQLIAWGFCGLMLAYISFQMWIPFVIINAGYSLEVSAWCTSLAAVGNVTGRIVMSLLSDRKFFNVRYGFMFGLLLTGISIIVFSLVYDIKFYIISTICWGLGVGSAFSLHITAMISVMGVEMLPAVLGVSALLRGFGGISIGTLAGVVRDATSTYTYAMWILGAGGFVAFFCWFFIPYAEKHDKKKYGNSEKEKKELQKC